MAILLTASNVVFTLSPGTGSTALRNYLLEQGKRLGGAIQVPEEDIRENGEVVVPQKHSLVSELKKYGILDANVDYQVCTGVRNPYEFWFAEWYRYRTRWVMELRKPDSWIFDRPNKVRTIVDCATMTFSDWIVDKFKEAYKNGEERELNGAFVQEAHAFIRKEHIETDLRSFLSQYYPQPVIRQMPGMKPANVSQRADEDVYWRHYTPLAREVISTVFAPSIRRSNYHF